MASNNPRIPTVSGGVLHTHDGATICALADRSAWLAWLEDEENRSFAFIASAGAHLSAIKERRQSTSGAVHYYWCAYRSVDGEKRRVWLGASGRVDLARLNAAATRLAQPELMPAQSGSKKAPSRGLSQSIL